MQHLSQLFQTIGAIGKVGPSIAYWKGDYFSLRFRYQHSPPISSKVQAAVNPNTTNVRAGSYLAQMYQRAWAETSFMNDDCNQRKLSLETTVDYVTIVLSSCCNSKWEVKS